MAGTGALAAGGAPRRVSLAGSLIFPSLCSTGNPWHVTSVFPGNCSHHDGLALGKDLTSSLSPCEPSRAFMRLRAVAWGDPG